MAQVKGSKRRGRDSVAGREQFHEKRMGVSDEAVRREALGLGDPSRALSAANYSLTFL